ncbi:MAG: TolA-binding protein [Woeseiaceae bacterium]|jgi:TolA-binding protein
MIRRPAGKLILLAFSGLLATGALAQKVQESDTIASLEGTAVELKPGGRSVVNTTDLARDNYRAFLELVSEDPDQRAEAMRRLGDLELEAIEEQQLTENIESLDESAFDDAVTMYHQLLESYPDYRRNDSVLYQLARAYEIAGKTDDALRVLNELVTKYPGTTLIDEIEFRRGEMLFIRKNYVDAELAYQSVADYGPESRFFEQSLYKLGWSQFKLAKHQDSLDPFFNLLDRKVGDIEFTDGDQRLENLSRAERELVEDTFRVLSITFSYMDGAESIDEFFDARGYPQYGYVIFMNLGDLYLEKERFVDAAETYEAFVEQDPDHAKSPLLQVEVIEAYKRGGFPTLVLDGKKQYVDRYATSSSYWQSNDRASNVTVETHLKDNLTDLAQYYHAEAQTKGEPEDYQEAANWHRKYLEYFPGQADSADTNFLLAEILFESKDYAAATAEYERTAYGYPFHENSAESGYAAILSYREHEAALQGDERAAWHQRYLDSGLQFADTYPQHAESSAVLTTVAEDLFAQEEFDLAVAVGESVVTKEPAVSQPLARTAWTVIAHSQFDLNNYAKAEQAYYQLRPLTPVDDVVAQQEIDDRIASSIYKQGEQARDAGNLEVAVAHFQRLGDAVPDSDIRATAEYDAAAALINMEDWGRASTVLEDFRSAYPDSEFADDITQKLAVSYLESGRTTQAAGEFIRIANAPGSTDDVRREALWRAADLYKEAEQLQPEQQILQDIVVRYPDPISESIEARYRMLEIAEQSGDQPARTRILEDLVYVDATAGAQRSDRTKYLAAIASLELAEPVRRSFMVLKISQPLAQSMELKQALMEDVLRVYGDAAQYGVAEVTTAATFRLGEVYQQFSKDLMSSERPKNLDEMALDQYDMLLEEQTFPFEEKAIELYETNASRAADGVYDEWVKKSFAALADLLPARYAKLERSENVVTALY